MVPMEVVVAVGGLVAAVTAFLAQLWSVRAAQRAERDALESLKFSIAGVGVELVSPREETIESRVERALAAFADARQAVEELVSEIGARREELQQLEEQHQLLKLSDAEIQAVQSAMLGALETQGRRSFWLGVLVNFVFFCAGVGVTLLVG